MHDIQSYTLASALSKVIEASKYTKQIGVSKEFATAIVEHEGDSESLVKTINEIADKEILRKKRAQPVSVEVAIIRMLCTHILMHKTDEVYSGASVLQPFMNGGDSDKE